MQKKEQKIEKLEFSLHRKKLLNAHGNSQWRSKMGKIAFLREIGREKGIEAKENNENLFFDSFEIIVTIKPPTRRKLDPPNYYPTVKPIIDGLTDAGWWEDDNFAHMLSTRFLYGGLAGITKEDGKNDNDMFRIILEIREILNPEEYITQAKYID